MYFYDENILKKIYFLFLSNQLPACTLSCQSADMSFFWAKMNLSFSICSHSRHSYPHHLCSFFLIYRRGKAHRCFLSTFNPFRWLIFTVFYLVSTLFIISITKNDHETSSSLVRQFFVGLFFKKNFFSFVILCVTITKGFFVDIFRKKTLTFDILISTKTLHLLLSFCLISLLCFVKINNFHFIWFSLMPMVGWVLSVFDWVFDFKKEENLLVKQRRLYIQAMIACLFSSSFVLKYLTIHN